MPQGNKHGFPVTPDEVREMNAAQGRGSIMAGFYRGRVEDIKDPEKRGRLKVRIQLLHPEMKGNKQWGIPTRDLFWAEPCFGDGGKDFGDFNVPYRLGDPVWVAFEAGNINYPVWFGGWYKAPSDGQQNKTEVPAQCNSDEEYPHRRIIKTRRGHAIEISDTKENCEIIIQDIWGDRIHMDTERHVLRIQWNGDVEEYVTGSVRRFVGGDVEETISGSVKRHVTGNTSELVDGSVAQEIKGTLDCKVGGLSQYDVQGWKFISAQPISIAVDGKLLVQATGEVGIKTDEKFLVDAGGEVGLLAGENAILNGAAVLFDPPPDEGGPPTTPTEPEAPEVVAPEAPNPVTEPQNTPPQLPEGTPPIWTPGPPFKPYFEDRLTAYPQDDGTS